MGKFIITSKAQSCTFSLRARNGEAIASSIPFSSLSACKRCIQSVIRTAPIAKFEDQCPRGKEITSVTNPKFELYKDKAGTFRFRLKARNGEVLLNSSSYTTKASCKTGISSVIKNVEFADIILRKLPDNQPEE